MGEGLTAEKLIEMMKTFPPPPDNDPFNFNNLLRPRFAGREIYEQPPAPPRIEVRDVKLKDGTSILTPAFRARINGELLERFGRRPSLFDDGKMYLLGSYGIACSQPNASILRILTNGG